MPWFKIDDGFHCNAKIMEAGTPAVGLYVRCGSWAAQQASDGRIPKSIARSYGTARMIKALVEAGLWHQAGHDCDSCPEVDVKSYQIHDYLEYNPSRVAIQNERNSKTVRQQRWREGKKKEQANAGDAPDVDGDVDASTSRHGDAAPPPPVPSRPSTSYGSTAAASEPTTGIPDALADLKQGIAAAGLQGIAWDLRESSWEYTRQAIDRVGIPAMVAFALNSARLKGPPAGASAWVQGWRSLEPPPARHDGVAYLPAALADIAPVSRQQQETDDQFDRAMARAKARMQQESS